MKEETLEDWKDTIGNEVESVDVKPYSHNIINIALQAIAKRYGIKEANNAIDEYNLEELGWNKVNENEVN